MKDTFLRQIPSHATPLSAYSRAFAWNETIKVGDETFELLIVAHENTWSGFGSPADPNTYLGPLVYLTSPGYYPEEPRPRTVKEARQQFIRSTKRLQKNY